MATKIIFTCPACGGHELMQIQQAVHRIPIDLQRTADGEWEALPVGSTQELKGRTLGYRCARCRYPDVPNHEDSDGFYWQTPEQIATSGALTGFAPQQAASISAFTICQPDGTTRCITLTPPHPGTLTVPERAAILAAHHAPAGSVLLMEGE